MAEFFKTLEFIGVEREIIGKYAHPINVEKGKLSWTGSMMPLLFTMKTSIGELKEIYKGLDFDLVKLVTKKLTDIETINT